jgi:hypothetical protein
MAQCPFAVQMPITGTSGSYTAGPFRIIHHTTEGTTAQAAFDAFKAKRANPHFTVDATSVHQHIDTGTAARALVHLQPQGETNRLSAIQIETVGFAGQHKSKKVLTNVARLLRWIEATHSIPRVWPNGPPKPPVAGGDPGGHNRNATNWVSQGGHYGHCHVPENTHWDPAYTEIETGFLMAAEFDAAGHMTNRDAAAVKALLDRPDLPAFGGDEPVPMPDHFDVGDTP